MGSPSGIGTRFAPGAGGAAGGCGSIRVTAVDDTIEELLAGGRSGSGSSRVLMWWAPEPWDDAGDGCAVPRTASCAPEPGVDVRTAPGAGDEVPLLGGGGAAVSAERGDAPAPT